MKTLEYFEAREHDFGFCPGWGCKLYQAQGVTHYCDSIPRVRAGFGNDTLQPGKLCGDCGCAYGEYHVQGCDMERCGNCGNQFITCNCSIIATNN